MTTAGATAAGSSVHRRCHHHGSSSTGMNASPIGRTSTAAPTIAPTTMAAEMLARRASTPISAAAKHDSAMYGPSAMTVKLVSKILPAVPMISSAMTPAPHMDSMAPSCRSVEALASTSPPPPSVAGPTPTLDRPSTNATLADSAMIDRTKAFTCSRVSGERSPSTAITVRRKNGYPLVRIESPFR